MEPGLHPDRLAQIALHVYPGGIDGFDLLAPASGLVARFARDRDDALRRALF